MPSALAAPLINGLVDDALLELSQKQTATLSFCKVVWRRYLSEVGKFYHTLWLIYPRHSTSISIKIGQVL